MKAPEEFAELEWAVARHRRSLERHEAREREEPGKGEALVLVTEQRLTEAVERYCGRRG